MDQGFWLEYVLVDGSSVLFRYYGMQDLSGSYTWDANCTRLVFPLDLHLDRLHSLSFRIESG